MTPGLQPSDIPNGYRELLEEIVGRIARSQTRAALAVSRELVLLYWSIGAEILLRQKAEGWGVKVIDRLGRDLQARVPGCGRFQYPEPQIYAPSTPPTPISPHERTKSSCRIPYATEEGTSFTKLSPLLVHLRRNV